MTTYILDTETTGLIEPHMTEAAYSIVDINDGKVTVLKSQDVKKMKGRANSQSFVFIVC